MSKRYFVTAFALFSLLISVSINSKGQSASFTSSLNPVTGCVPVTVQFNNTSTGNSSNLWDFGDASGNSTATNPSHTYSIPGTYTVTLTINSNGPTATNTITVHGIPDAGFTESTDTICIGNAVVFTDTSHANDGNIIKWKWDFGDGGIDSTTGGVISHTYNTAGTYSVSVQVFNTYGCYDNTTVSHQIHVVNGPTANFSMAPTFACAPPALVQFTNSTSNNSGVTYLWNFGDPGSGTADTSTATDPSHSFTTTGTFTITLSAISPGCVSTHSTTFTIFNITSTINSVDSVCLNSPVSFSSTTSPSPSSYSWNFGDFTTSSSAAPSHAYSVAGTYTVTLTVTLSNGCQKTVNKNIVVLPLPTVNFVADDSTICSIPASVTFTGSSSASGATYLWNFGTGPGWSQGNPINYVYPSQGTDSVSLIVVDAFGCRDTLVKLNYINIAVPIAQFIPPVDSGCVGNLFTFTSTSTSPVDPITTYNWSFGDGNTATGNPVSHAYSATGIYTIKLVITTAEGCKDSITHTVRVGLVPTALFSYDNDTLCFGDPVHFLDLSTPTDSVTGWYWTFGDGGTSLGQNPTHYYDQDTGLFTVTLIAYWNGCPDTLDSNLIILVYPPKPQFTIDPYDCSDPFTVHFHNTSLGADSVYWAFGDMTYDSTNAQNPTHVYTTVGTYSITLSAYNIAHNCRYSTTMVVEITDPIARIDYNDTARCYPATINFSSLLSQSASAVSWDFGDPPSGILNTSIATTPQHIYNAIGSYVVTLIVTDVHGCKDTAYQTIYAYGNVAAFSAAPLNGCNPFFTLFDDSSYVFTAGTPITTYQWNFGDGSPVQTVSTDTVSHIYGAIGNYSVTLTITDAHGCSSTVTKPNYVHVTRPAPTFSPDAFLCPDDNTIFSVTPGVLTAGYSVTWNFGDGSPSITNPNVSSQSHIYTLNGNYTISVTVTDANGCDSTVSKNVYVWKPTASYSLTYNNYCGQTDITLTGGDNPADSISFWYFTLNGPFGSIKNNSFNPSSNVFNTTLNIPGVWSMTLIVQNPGPCYDTLHIDTLIVVPGPQGYFTFEPDTGCQPLTVTFYIHPDNAEYIVVDFRDGIVTGHLPITDTVVTHTYYGPTGSQWDPAVLLGYTLNGTTQCQVSAINLNDVANGHDTLVTIINPATYFVTDSVLSLNEGESHTLTSSPAYNPLLTYTWSIIPTGASLALQSPPSNAIYTAVDGDSLILFVATDAAGCQSRDTVRLIIRPCDRDLIVPNVFTPNDDNLNDEYYIDHLCQITDFWIKIYNRWGNIVYKSSAYDFHWDGKDDNGKDCSDGTYYYVLHAKRTNLHGYIQLIRDKSTK
jgi:gliding motility-associated-like protein